MSVAMVGRVSCSGLFLFTCCLVLQSTYGGYLITLPKDVTPGYPTQFCIFVDDRNAPEGNLQVTVRDTRRRPSFINHDLDSGITTEVHPDEEFDFVKNITVKNGIVNTCEELDIPRRKYSRGRFNITGSIGGKDINETRTISIKNTYRPKVYIQTDKNFYLAGQTVQFRIMTISGPHLNISTDNYPEVWVETPSRTRIAQWLDVDNSAGIVHLNMDLIDEPEEGSYVIYVRNSLNKTSRRSSQRFRVGEFVLPKFQVEIKKPVYVLSTHDTFNFTVCARYTFGQPVKGNVTVNLNNGRNGFCQVNIVRRMNVTGCETIELSSRELRVTDCDVNSVPVSVNFEEEGTGVQKAASDRIYISRNPISLNEVYSDTYMKPNLPLTVKVRAENPDGSPAPGIPVEVCAGGGCNNMTSAEDGVFTIVLPEYRTHRLFIKTTNCRADLHSTTYSKNMDYFYSPSNSSLMIYAPEKRLKCTPGQPVTHNLPVLFAATNQSSATITVQVVSRGQMQHWKTEEYTLTPSALPFQDEHFVEPLQPPTKDTVRGVINIPLSLPPTASPSAQVLIWYTRDDGEVVSDHRELQVDKCLTNSADLTWAIEKGEPGQETTLSLSSKPNSICSLGVVDRSTLLLSEAGGKMSVNSLFNYANQFEINKWTSSQIDDYSYCEAKRQKEIAGTVTSDDPNTYYSYNTLHTDNIQMFENTGLYVFSDLEVETRPCESSEENYRPFIAESPPPQNFASFAPSAGFSPVGALDDLDVRPQSQSPSPQAEKSSPETDQPRTEFPETWLWDIVVIPSSGVLSQNVTLPDTITEWVGNAVCSLPGEGVGISKETSVTTFLPFFIDLTLPPSIKRGEILPVKISVFNYLQQNLPVTVRLEASEEYEILEDSSSPGPKGQKTICLESQDKDVQTVRINATALGDVNLTVTAYVDYEGSQNCQVADQSVTRRDTIIKPIKVEAEGYPREKTWTKYICARDFETGDDSLEDWDVNPSRNIVEGSARGWVTAVADLLALSLENLGNLIRMPSGCGEQNMVNFAPNIFLMKYLDATEQNTPESAAKLKRFMTTGYRRELLYRHDNGAYSAFGKADDFASTWLTAFVLKSFAQAQPYILIDQEGLNETRRWLHEKQDGNGCFLAIGKIFHKGISNGLQGGVVGTNNSISLTTYVMISLLEAGEDPGSKIIASAKRCLESEPTQDPYTLALKAYAFALAKLPEANETITELLELATITKNAAYWSLPNRRSNGLELETAAYAVLAMVEQNFDLYEQQARKIVKWIISKRNGYGGFYSTQDTVMALQALASYETFLYQGPLDVKATVNAKNLNHTFSVVETNRLLQQLVLLPTIPTNVSFNMEGLGCAVLQAVMRYNIPDPEGSDAFDLTVNSRTEVDKTCKTKLFTACASYKLPDEKSNMAVIEVNLVSGYIPEKEDLKSLVANNREIIKRYEIDGSKVTFYIEELTSKSTCVNFRIIREVDVENVKPGTVVVYDYYQPELSISENYSLPAPHECRY